ncbi:tyrosine-type recombinase/integrase [Spiribacter insolitus]|uniref:Tyrosine-type recombinase/integrase n=1 Tax=Spiribacter insolitus TaxID=3122417 RepID=A0ABV3T569_9GAMM
MAVLTLTAEAVRRVLAQPPRHRPRLYADPVTRGLYLEVRPSGGATWYFRYRDLVNRTRMYRINAVERCSVDEAREEVLRLRRHVDDGGDPMTERRCARGPATLEEFIRETYLPHVRSRKRSWRSEVSLIERHLLPTFGDRPIRSISGADVVRWQEERLQAGYAVGTCNRLLVQLCHIFNCAIRWGILADGTNPTEGVKPLTGEKKHERYLSPDEVARLLAVLDNARNVQLADIIRLLLVTGARKREVLDARWEFVNLEDAILTVPRSKSGKPRHIVLANEAIEVLHRQPREPDNPWVFPNPRTGRPFVTIYYGWDTIRRRAGLSDVRLHDLRHSFASFLVNSGRSLYEVQVLLGHASPQTTMRYAHLSRDSLRSATDSAMVAMLRGGAES